MAAIYPAFCFRSHKKPSLILLGGRNASHLLFQLANFELLLFHKLLAFLLGIEGLLEKESLKIFPIESTKPCNLYNPSHDFHLKCLLALENSNHHLHRRIAGLI